jgi:hypothetical protein
VPLTNPDECDWLWNPDWQPDAETFIADALRVAESAFANEPDVRADEIRAWADTVQEWKRNACL